MPDRVFCDKHDPNHYAKWAAGTRPFLDDTCYMCATEQLEQQLQQAHRAGWEQVKRESFELALNYVGKGCVRSIDAESVSLLIAAMEYGGEK